MKERKQKFENQFVVIYRGKYWGLDFERREAKEISFEEAFGSGFFDWDNMICIATESQKRKYEIARNQNWIDIVRQAHSGLLERLLK